MDYSMSYSITLLTKSYTSASPEITPKSFPHCSTEAKALTVDVALSVLLSTAGFLAILAGCGVKLGPFNFLGNIPVKWSLGMVASAGAVTAINVVAYRFKSKKPETSIKNAIPQATVPRWNVNSSVLSHNDEDIFNPISSPALPERNIEEEIFGHLSVEGSVAPPPPEAHEEHSAIPPPNTYMMMMQAWAALASDRAIQ